MPLTTGAGGERPAAEGEGGRDPGQAGGPQCRAGQRRRRQRGEGLERRGPPAAHQSRQPVSCWNQRQVGTQRISSGALVSVAVRGQPTRCCSHVLVNIQK